MTWRERQWLHRRRALSLLDGFAWMLLAVVGCPSSAAAQGFACDPVTLTSGQSLDGEFRVSVGAARLRNAPDWKPGSGEPPVSAGKAIAVVQDWVNSNASELEPLRIAGLRLQSASCNDLKDRWFYVVEYAAIVPEGVAPKLKRSAILMDGTIVVAQEIEKKNASSESARAGGPLASRWPETIVIDLSRSEWASLYDGQGVKFFSLLASRMLRGEKFDQLDAELSRLLDTRQRLLDGRLAYPVIVTGIRDTISYGDANENTLDLVKKWREHSPSSRHAPIVEALFWRGYAWYARGSMYSNSVSERGWALFRERNANARRALEDTKAITGTNPLWQTVMISVAWDQNWPPAELNKLFVDAVKRDPWFLAHYFAMSYRMTPRWGGGIDQYREFVEDTVTRTRGTEGITMYALLYANYADIEFDQAFDSLEIPWPKMNAGFEELIARYPTPWNLNSYARFACQAKDKEAFLKLLPKLAPAIVRPAAWPSGYSFENCKESFTART